MDLRDCIKKTPIKILIGVLVLLLAILWVWLVPFEHALNKYFNSEFIESYLRKKDNVQIIIENLRYKTNSDFSISISADKLLINDGNDEIIRSVKLNTRMNIFAFFLNTLSGELNAQSLSIKIVKDKDGNINLLSFFSDKSKRNKLPSIKKISLNIGKYEIVYKDYVVKSIIKLDGNNFVVDDYLPSKFIKFNTSGSLKIANINGKFYDNAIYDLSLKSKLPIRKNLNNKNFDFNVNVTNLNLKDFSPFTRYLFADDVKLSGDISAFVNTKLDEDSLTKKLVGKIITQKLEIKGKTPEKLTFLEEKTDIVFNTILLKDSVVVENFEFSNIYNNINVKGNILHTNSSKPFLDLEVKLHNDYRSMLYNLVPSEFSFEDNLISKIKKYNPKATLDGVLKFKGDFFMPAIEGEIQSENFFIDLPIAKEAKSKIKLIFNKKRMQIVGEVEPNQNAKVFVDGSLNIYGEKNAVFKIKSDDKVKLTVVKSILIPIQDCFRLNFGVLNQIFINSGYGNAELEISGTRKNSIINGFLNFYDAQARFEGISALVNNASGKVIFNGRKIAFSTNRADVLKYPISIDGNAEIFGDFDVNVSAQKIGTQYLLDLVKSSPLLKSTINDVKEINYIRKIQGEAEAIVNLKGNAGTKDCLNFEKINYSGSLNLKNNNVFMNNFATVVNLSNLNSTFDKEKIKASINAKLLNSSINVDVLSNKDLSIVANADKFLLNDLLTIVDKKEQYKRFLSQSKNKSFLKFHATYKAPKDKVILDNLKINAQLLLDEISPFYTSKGEITLEKSKVKLDNIDFNMLDAKLLINGVINNVFDIKRDYDLNCALENFDISIFNNFTNYKMLGDDFKRIIAAYKDYKGKISGTLNFKPNNIYGKLFVRDIGFVHRKMGLPILINSSDIIFNGTSVSIPTVHGSVDNIPVLIKLDINNFIKKPLYSGYITTNLYPSFVNKYINPNLGYPIKLKGEMQFKSYFNGNSDKIKTTTILNFPVNSDISYMGASLDDKEFERELKFDIVQSNRDFQINKAVLSKYIRSQNGVRLNYPYVSATGKVKLLDNDIAFNNLNIKTHEQTNSKIFNILFKKSILKYGKFDCDLRVSGTYKKPQIQGFINLKNLDMPLYETIVKDIFADFKSNNINLKVLGSVYDTEIVASANLKNKLQLPYYINNLEINADYLDLDKVFNSLSSVSMRTFHEVGENQNDVNMKTIPAFVVIDKGQIMAKKVLVREFPATDLVADLSLGVDNILQVERFDFNLAQGKVKAKGRYDFNLNVLEGDCIVNDINANQFSQIFLNLKNQIYGNLDGVVYFKTTGTTPLERIQNLDAKVSFDITDGKMPKLGSLEYLLRAANLIKSGITGFTINNMIDLLIPVKTGDFSLITGNLSVNEGQAQNIEISSTGKNLSLYITGNADIVNQNAQMVVLGRLSKKLSTILGPIGNTSLNTLFNFIPGIDIDENESQLVKELNKIPFLELSENNDYRFFQATVDGDLNSDEFVQTFKWLE